MGFYFEMELATHLIKAMSAYSWPTVDLTPPTLIRDATSRMSRRKALSAELLNMNEACDALVALQQQLAGIRSYLKQRLRAVTNALAPVSCLPAEVLREIFLTVYMKDPFSNDRLSISRVCSVWRSISLATPHLWATVRATQFARFGDWLSMHAQRSQPLPMDFIMTMGNDEYPSLTGTVKALEEVTLRFASVSFVHRKEHILEGAYAFPYSRYKCQAFPAYPSWAQDIAFSILPKDLENQGSSKYRSHRSALGPYTRSLRITNAVSLWEWGNEEQKLTSLKHVVISGIQMGDVRRVFKDLSLAPALEVLWIAGTEFDEEDFEGLDSEDESDDLAVVRRAKTTPNLGSLQYLAINNCASDLLKFVFGRRFWRTPALTHLTLTFADSEWRMPNVQSFVRYLDSGQPWGIPSQCRNSLAITCTFTHSARTKGATTRSSYFC